MVYGYAGTILRVNLTVASVRKQQLSPELARRFLGGLGVAAKILFDEVAPNLDSLSPQNKLIFATGPVTGCPVPGANRFVIVTKSPETGLFLDTYAGGHFAPELKFAGYDAIIIEGRAKKPVYMKIADDDVEINDALHIWGKDSWEAETILKNESGEKEAKVAVIGPAGENLVSYAVVSTDYYHQCGRGGAGAVMGSKNLKGILVSGTKGLYVFNPKKLLNHLKNEIEWKYTKGPSSQIVRERVKYGTPLTMDFTQSLGILPTKNFKYGWFENYDKINCYVMREKLVVSDDACYACMAPCCKLSVVKDGPYAGAKVGGPEYETLALLGSNLAVGDINAIVEANVLCDRLGLDTISCGNVIGFIMECYEKGLLTKEDTGGLDLRFGNVDSVLQLIQKIAYKEGIGNLVAKGVRLAAQKIGKESEKFAMHVKGLEYPAYDPRGSLAYALLYAVTPRGACHRRAWPILVEAKKLKPLAPDGRAELVKELYNERVILHCGLVCDFTYAMAGIGLDDFAVMLNAVTGCDYTQADLLKLADRVVTLTRAYNVREGKDRKDDYLSPRTSEESLMAGSESKPPVTRKVLDKMLDDYYNLRGWDKRGIPTRETLEKLGLNDLEEELVKLGENDGHKD